MVSKAWRLLCFGAASVPGGCSNGGRRVRRKNKGWEVRKVSLCVQQAHMGRASGGKRFADAALSSVLLSTMLAAASALGHGSLGTCPKL